MTEGDSTKVLDTSSASTLFTGKVCLCPTNFVFADKEPCPLGEKKPSKVGFNHSIIPILRCKIQ